MKGTSRLKGVGPLGVYSDAARRLSDIVMQAITDEGHHAIGRWVAARLSDGGSDGVLYPSKQLAIRHQLHETQCAYVCIPPEGMTAQAAESFLEFNRQLYDNGYRMPDPN